MRLRRGRDARTFWGSIVQGMGATTRGPLRPEVYWRRRMAVLSVAAVLVLAITRVSSHGNDGTSGDGEAGRAGTSLVTSPTVGPAATEPSGKPNKKQGKKRGGKKPGKGGKAHHGGTVTVGEATASPSPTPTLPEPTGPCADNDVYITPGVASPDGGSDVTVLLSLQTKVSAACTWQLSSETVRIDIVSGSDKIWSSQDCPSSIPVGDVTVRQASVTQVSVLWNVKRSNNDCSGHTRRAKPGFYHVIVTPAGGEPVDVQFQLVVGPK